VMNRQRVEKETVLYGRMAKHVNDYPLSHAFDDWVAFFLAGNIANALSQMGTEAKVKELHAIEALEKLKSLADAKAENLAKLEEIQAKKEVEEAEARAGEKTKLLDLISKGLPWGARPGTVPDP